MKKLIALLQKNLFAFFATLLMPSLALADNSETPVGEGLGYLTNAMYGTTGISIATLAIIGVGVACYFHYLEWKRLIQTVAGVAIVYGAPAVVQGIISLVHQQ